MPILDAISNSVSALPAASVGQGASGQRTPAGFSSTLAAAQALSATLPAPQSVAGKTVVSNTPVAAIAQAAAHLDVRAPALANSQLKRLLSSSPVMLSATAAVNVVVPEIIPVIASQVSLPTPHPGSLQMSLPAVLGVTAAVRVPDIAAAKVLPQWQIAAPVASLTSFGETAGNQTDRSTSTALISDLASLANTRGTATVDSAPPPSSTAMEATTTPNVVLPRFEPSSQENIPQAGSWSAGPVMPAESVQPSALSTTAAQPVPVALSPVLANGQENLSPAVGAGLQPAEPAFRVDQAVEPAKTGPAAGVLLASANLQTLQGSASNGLTQEAVGQTDLSGQVATGNPVSPITNGQISAAPLLNLLNPPSQLPPVRVLPRYAAPRLPETVAAPNIRGAGQDTGAPTSTVAAPLQTATESGKRLPLANQTPFSVFFSGPGPGAESAVSALPKMILPVTGSAIRDSHSAGPDTSASSASTQSSGSQSPITHLAAPQSSRDSSARDQSGSSQAGQPLRHGGDVNAASVPLAAPQTAAAPSPVTPAPVAVAVIQSVGLPAAPVTDSLPKTWVAPGGVANVSPKVQESSAMAVPGPVQMAQLINRVEQSEMRIGMKTSAFGGVEVRTVVHANEVGLVIGSERGDLRGLLTNDMPAIAQTLQEQNLRLHSVNFMQGFAFSNHASGGGDSQPRPFVPKHADADLNRSEPVADDSIERPAPVEFSEGRSSLSILA
jgi:hypothetical protein